MSENKKKHLPDWRQVLAGAGSAVTVAWLGSQLGVAGTLFGAAFGSVAGAFATVWYRASVDNASRVAVEKLGMKVDEEGKVNVPPTGDVPTPQQIQIIKQPTSKKIVTATLIASLIAFTATLTWFLWLNKIQYKNFEYYYDGGIITHIVTTPPTIIIETPNPNQNPQPNPNPQSEPQPTPIPPEPQPTLPTPPLPPPTPTPTPEPSPTPTPTQPTPEPEPEPEPSPTPAPTLVE